MEPQNHLCISRDPTPQLIAKKLFEVNAGLESDWKIRVLESNIIRNINFDKQYTNKHHGEVTGRVNTSSNKTIQNILTISPIISFA